MCVLKEKDNQMSPVTRKGRLSTERAFVRSLSGLVRQYVWWWIDKGGADDVKPMMKHAMRRGSTVSSRAYSGILASHRVDDAKGSDTTRL
jgi:hypothetical protein